MAEPKDTGFESIKAADSVSKKTKYPVEDFASVSAKLYGYPSECVWAAFKDEGIQEATQDEAKDIINNFMKREVRN